MDLTLSPSMTAYRDDARVRLAEAPKSFGPLAAQALEQTHMGSSPTRLALLCDAAGYAGIDPASVLTLAVALAAKRHSGWTGAFGELTEGRFVAVATERRPRLRRTAEGLRLDGAAGVCVGGPDCRLLVTVATTEDGLPAVLCLPFDAPGVHATPGSAFATPALHLVQFDDTPIEADMQIAGPELAADIDIIGALCLSGHMIGSARRASELAAAHARDRKVFKRPLGSFQSIAHSLADMAIRTEAGALLVAEAFWVLDAGMDHELHAAQAKAFASEYAPQICRAALEILGGSGFLAGNPLAARYHSAVTCSLLFGTATVHLKTIAQYAVSQGPCPRVAGPDALADQAKDDMTG